MRISGLFQFILGFFLGVILLIIGSAGAAYYFFNRMASSPPRPVFPEETTKPKKTADKPQPTTTATKPKEEPKPTPAPEEDKKLPDNAYRAKVTWKTGLSLRAEPSLDAERLGGVDYNTEIIVLETSPDKQWQHIRLESGQDAWIKAGNTEKVEP